MTDGVSYRELIEVARDVQSDAYTPYSGYDVGAALLTADETVYRGCNVEVANYSNSLHAEEVALAQAVVDGHRDFAAVAVSTGPRDGQTPCGMCRQSLAEFCDEDFRVITDNGGSDPVSTTEYTLGELLPAAITPADLGVDD